MEPRLIHMEPGGWLALTDPDSPVPVGVFGATREEAVEKLDEALQERERLRAKAPTPV